MTKSRTQLMVDHLRELQASSPDIEASAVVSVDGLIIASALPSDVEEDRVSAMSAAVLSLGVRISAELGREFPTPDFSEEPFYKFCYIKSHHPYEFSSR